MLPALPGPVHWVSERVSVLPDLYSRTSAWISMAVRVIKPEALPGVLGSFLDSATTFHVMW